MSIITIVGAGMMGSAMSGPAADNGHEIRLVGTPLDREIIDSVRETGFHPTLHKQLPAAVAAFQAEELDKALRQCIAAKKPSLINVQLGADAGKESGHIGYLNPAPLQPITV